MKTIVLTGPGKNALSTSVMESTLTAVRDAGSEPILLTGDGDVFSAGLNLKEIASLDVAGMGRFLVVLEDLVKTLYEHPAPVVAWVNGHAIAGGCVLAVTADLRIMTARAGVRIGLNEVALGLRFPPLTYSMLRARLTPTSFQRALLEAALYEAPVAKELGLIDVIGDEAAARDALDRLASHPRDIYAATKEQLRGRLSVLEDEQRRFRQETIPHWASPAMRASILAVLDKRASGGGSRSGTSTPDTPSR